MNCKRNGLAAFMVLAIATFWVGAAEVHAVGGDDVNTAKKVSKDTEKCGKAIADKGNQYIQKRAKAINSCLDTVLKCDEQADAVKAAACRAKAVDPGKGKCSVGKLDGGATTIGAGASNGVNKTNKPTLDKELAKYRDAIQKACFTPGKLADVTSILTGMGFNPLENPTDADSLMDQINNDDDGVSCLANQLVLETTPLANEIVALLDPNNNSNVAFALREEGGSISSCPRPLFTGANLECRFDRQGICFGGTTPGIPCAPLGSLACPDDPLVPSNRGACLAKSRILVFAPESSPGAGITTLPISVIGSIGVNCDPEDPNTNGSSCTCDFLASGSIFIPGIGVACLEAFSGCPAGELTCDAGARVDTKAIMDHDIGFCSGTCTGGTQDGKLCAASVQLGSDFDQCNPFIGDPTSCTTPSNCTTGGGTCGGGQADCATQCDAYCDALGPDYEFFEQGCENFCFLGDTPDVSCNVEGDCPNGSCSGKDAQSPKQPFCQCKCLQVGGAESAVADEGSLTCSIGIQITVFDTADPNAKCEDQTDNKLLELPDTCIPITTGASEASITNFERHQGSGVSFGPFGTQGASVTCHDLNEESIRRLQLGGTLTFGDSNIGDLVIPLTLDCADDPSVAD